MLRRRPRIIGFLHRRPSALATLYVCGLLATLTHFSVAGFACLCHCHDAPPSTIVATTAPGAATLSSDHLESCDHHRDYIDERIDALAPVLSAPPSKVRGLAVLPVDTASPCARWSRGVLPVASAPCLSGHEIGSPSRAPPCIRVV